MQVVTPVTQSAPVLNVAVELETVVPVVAVDPLQLPEEEESARSATNAELSSSSFFLQVPNARPAVSKMAIVCLII